MSRLLRSSSQSAPERTQQREEVALTDSQASDDDPIGYIRGAGAVRVDGRHLLRVLLTLCVAVLACLAIVLTVQAWRANGRAARLEQHGIRVRATVTSCLGLASGTGITASGYQCKASFDIGDRHYDAVLRGSSALVPVGTTVAAVTDPDDPANLSTAGSVAGGHKSWAAFAPPAIAVALMLAAALALRGARRSVGT